MVKINTDLVERKPMIMCEELSRFYDITLFQKFTINRKQIKKKKEMNNKVSK